MIPRSAIVKQFKQPSGFLGWLAGNAMALRPSNRRRNAWTIALLDLARDDRVFELGCGPGLALARAARQCKKGHVFAVDHSPAMVRMASRRLAGPIRKKRVTLDIGDDTALEWFEENLNAIYSVNVIQFIDDRAAYFERAWRALLPGGRLASTYQPRGAQPSARQAEDMARRCATEMTKAGFADLRVQRLELKPVPAVCIVGARPR